AVVGHLESLSDILRLAVRPRIMQDYVQCVRGEGGRLPQRLKNARLILNATSSLPPDQKAWKASMIEYFVTRPCSAAPDLRNEIIAAASVGMAYPLLHAWIAALKQGVTESGGHQW